MSYLLDLSVLNNTEYCFEIYDNNFAQNQIKKTVFLFF